MFAFQILVDCRRLQQTTRLEPSQIAERAATFLRNDAADVTIVTNESVPILDYSKIKTALVSDVTA